MSRAITFIADEDISALSTVLNPVKLGNYLAPVLPSRWGTLRDVEIKVLKHHRGKRCAIEITLQTASGKYELIGKVYAQDRSDVFLLMERLVRSGLGPDDEFSIPPPLAYLPSIRFLVYEKAQGQRAKDILLAGDDQSRAMAAERCALWLARFQATEPQSERIVSLSDQLILLDQWAHEIADLGYPLEDKARQLYKQLEAAAAALNDVEACACHGSYSSDQIILADGRTVTIDWDGYEVADPARDVAKFIIELRRLAQVRFGSMRALDAVGEVFLQTYFAASKFKTTEQLPYYVAATCLKAADRIVHRQAHDWYKKVEALLNEGLRTLEKAGADNAYAV